MGSLAESQLLTHLLQPLDELLSLHSDLIPDGVTDPHSIGTLLPVLLVQDTRLLGLLEQGLSDLLDLVVE